MNEFVSNGLLLVILIAFLLIAYRLLRVKQVEFEAELEDLDATKAMKIFELSSGILKEIVSTLVISKYYHDNEFRLLIESGEILDPEFNDDHVKNILSEINEAAGKSLLNNVELYVSDLYVYTKLLVLEVCSTLKRDHDQQLKSKSN